MCPACKEPMAIFELEGIEIDRCLRCAGTWLDAGELDQMARLSGAPPGKLTQALERAEGDRDGDRRCPRCSGRLRKIRVEGVDLDRCPRGDGLWFDKNEIESVIGTFKDGEEGAAARFFADLFAADRRKGT